MYSVGVGNDWSFQVHALKAARELVVHAYDPTVQLEEKHRAAALALGSRVNFHFMGLGGGDPPTALVGQTQNAYGSLATSSLWTLRQLVDRNPPEERQIDILTIDCEGCEWAALEQLWVSGDSLLRSVKLLMIELHLSPTMVPPTPQQFANLFTYLFDVLDFRLWFIRSNEGYPFDQQVADFIGTASADIDPGLCCYELALVRRKQGGGGWRQSTEVNASTAQTRKRSREARALRGAA